MKTYTHKCQRCGTQFENRGTVGKYCPKCRRIVKNIQARNCYYRKKGYNDKILKIPSKTKPKQKDEKLVCCPYDNCPFKSGNKPCLFYFEYKDGTTSCPGKRFMKGSDKIGLEKRSD